MTGELDENNHEFAASMKLYHRTVSEQQRRTFEGYVQEIFTAYGLDLKDPATRETPRRFLDALSEITCGYDGDPKLLKVFETECRGGPDCRNSQIVEGPINFFSLCEHHALPFWGYAYVGYVSHEHIIGISKLTRLVRLFAARFTLQERIGQQIADTLEEILKPHGVAVFLQGHHLCSQMRGVREVPPLTRTSFWRGLYDTDPAMRQEFFTQCGTLE